jgi:hypothetical protein
MLLPSLNSNGQTTPLQAYTLIQVAVINHQGDYFKNDIERLFELRAILNKAKAVLALPNEQVAEMTDSVAVGIKNEYFDSTLTILSTEVLKAS